MTFSTDEIKTMTFDKLYQLLIPTLNNIKEEYSYISTSNSALDKWLKKIVEEKYNRIINSDKVVAIDFSVTVENNINRYLRKTFTEGNGLELFNRYVDKNLKKDENSQKSFKKLIAFFNEFNYYPSNDLCIAILNNNKVKSILSDIVVEKRKLLETNTLEEIFFDDIEVAFVENYCLLNNISINRNDDLNDYIDDSLASYFSSIKLPLLTKEEEIILLTRIKQGDKRAKDIMIERNIRLVIKMARKYSGRGLELLDLIQEGNIGLMIAVDRFDLEKDCKFSTYATWWIKQVMTRAIDDKGRTIRLPVYISEWNTKIRNAKKELQKELNRIPTDEEVATKLNISTDKLDELSIVSQSMLSLNQNISEEDDGQLSDYIEDESIVSPEIEAIENVAKEELEKVISTLKPREQQIIRLRFGFDDSEAKSLQEIGDILGISGERVRQLESRSLKELKQKILRKQKKIVKIDIKESENKVLRKKRNNRRRTANDLKNIYSYFKGYEKEQIQEAIQELDEKSVELLHKRYGEDFDNPIYNSLSNKDRAYLYSSIFVRMKRHLRKYDTSEITTSKENEKVLINNASKVYVKTLNNK